MVCDEEWEVVSRISGSCEDGLWQGGNLASGMRAAHTYLSGVQGKKVVVVITGNRCFPSGIRGFLGDVILVRIYGVLLQYSCGGSDERQSDILRE